MNISTYLRALCEQADEDATDLMDRERRQRIKRENAETECPPVDDGRARVTDVLRDRPSGAVVDISTNLTRAKAAQRAFLREHQELVDRHPDVREQLDAAWRRRCTLSWSGWRLAERRNKKGK
jgi:hypothetical protein